MQIRSASIAIAAIVVPSATAAGPAFAKGDRLETLAQKGVITMA